MFALITAGLGLPSDLKTPHPYRRNAKQAFPWHPMLYPDQPFPWHTTPYPRGGKLTTVIHSRQICLGHVHDSLTVFRNQRAIWAIRSLISVLPK